MKNILLFEEFNLNEKYYNLFTQKDKSRYAVKLFDMLQKSYHSIGGIKGNGFSSPKDIVENIPFIKMLVKNSEILCASFYKDKDGRKSVAITTNGTKDAKDELKIIKENDFKRSYCEISHSMLIFMQRNFPDLIEKYKIPNTSDLEIFKDIIRIDDYYYKRKIGDEYITKIAIGTPYIKIY